MKQYKLGIETDREKVDQALKLNPFNEYNPEILKHPTLRVLRAYSENEEHFLPTQQVLMLESLSKEIPPDALRDLVKGAELLASSNGIKELYFLDGANGISEFAKGKGFQELPYKVFRMKL